MMRYAFSGESRELTPDEGLALLTIVQALDPEPEQIHTGCAYGVDTAAAYAAALAWPDAEHHLWVPESCWHNAELVEKFRLLGHHVHVVPWQGSPGKTYMARNDELVAHCHALIAVPQRRVEAMRGSGTWATVRRARKAGRTIFLHPLDELEEGLE